MGVFARLPWWSAFPLSGGFGLVGIFAPDAVPEWLRIALFWTGVALLAIGVAAAVWHYRPTAWLAQHVWWRFGRLPPTKDHPLPAAAQLAPPLAPRTSKAEAWIPLHQALRYLVYDTAWSHTQAKPASEDEFNKLVSSELFERLARGEVRARGAKSAPNKGDNGRPTEDISLDYWAEACAQPHDVIALGQPSQDVVVNPRSHLYHRVLIHQNDMKAVWPRATTTSLTPLASFVDPVRKRIESESGALPQRDLASFGYSYRKAVLKAAIPKAAGDRAAVAGQPPHEMSIIISILNEHRAPLRNCSVAVLGLADGDQWTDINELLRAGKDGIFPIDTGKAYAFTFLKRNISDRVTPEPFHIRLVGREWPLRERASYTMVLELRSPYPIPTIVILSIVTGDGLDAEVTVVDTRLAEDDEEEAWRRPPI